MAPERLNRHLRYALSAVAAAALCALAPHANALDSIALVGGEGNEVEVLGIEAGWTGWKRWRLGERRQLSLDGMVGAARWRGRQAGTQYREVYDFSVAPVLRLEDPTPSRVSPYFEASFGWHLLSATRINSNRELGSAFQFGEFIGAGLTFGSRRQLALGARLHHVSNAGIKKPNDGLTFGSIALRYEFGGR